VIAVTIAAPDNAATVKIVLRMIESPRKQSCVASYAKQNA
jgi:hypothetical protein